MARALLLAALVGLGIYLFPQCYEAGSGVARIFVRTLQQGLVTAREYTETHPGPHARLLSAARNVTTDQEGLGLLVGRFLSSRTPELEEEFVAFLQREAATSRVGLERSLDTLLSLYRFFAPFLVVSAVIGLFRGPKVSSGQETPVPTKPADEGTALSRDLDPSAAQASEEAKRKGRLPTEALRRLFREIDTNQDGQISKRELLLALRRDASLADLLGLPAKVSQSRADGSYTAFEAAFSHIDQDRDDAISWAEFENLFRRRQREAVTGKSGRQAGSGTTAGGGSGNRQGGFTGGDDSLEE